jgi:hypothetical protein
MGNDRSSVSRSRLWLFVFIISLVAASAVLFRGDRLAHLSRFFEGAAIRSYLGQLRAALLAFPLFLIWLQISRRSSFVERLAVLRGWWLTSGAVVLVSLSFFLAVTLFVALFAYHGVPQADAASCWFQTKLFAAGRFYAPAPRYPEFFAIRSVIIHDGRWFSFTSPGHSLTLLPGYLLGPAWLVGPLLGTIAVGILYLLTRDLLGQKIGRIALLVAATSPFMIFLFASYEFHVTSTFFTILALYLLGRRGMGFGSGLGVGLSLGAIFLARPYTAVGVGLPLLAYVAVRQRPRLMSMLLGGATLVLLHLVYNRILTGEFLTFPAQLLGQIHGIGFSPDFGVPSFGLQGHSPLRALINTGYAAFALSLQLSGWLFLSLVFFVPAGFSSGWRKSWWVHASALGLVAAYLLYWYHGVTPWGPKYWSEALPGFVIASATGIRAAKGGIRCRFGLRPDFALRALPFLIAYALLVYVPIQIRYFASCQWGETPKVNRQTRAGGLHNALVFVHTDESSGSFDYSSAFIFNDPLLKSDVVYARDLGDNEDARLMRLFPERGAYLYDFNTDTVRPLLVPESPAELPGGNGNPEKSSRSD